MLALCACKDNTEADRRAPTPRVEVSVVTLHPQSVAITADLPGRTAASLVSEIRPQVTGIIRERQFKEGGDVKIGDPLYLIDPATYQAAYDNALATLAQAEAAVPSARNKVDRYKILVQKKAIASQDFDDATATLQQATAAVAIARANVATARINLDNTRIVAPINGQIDRSSLTPGALVSANQTTLLTTIRTIDPIFVDVTKSSSRFLQLREAMAKGVLKISGDNVRVRLRLDDGSFYTQDGQMESREDNVSQTTGTFALRAVFPNPDHLLLPGMYVRAVVEEGVRDKSFLAPQRAVSHDNKGESVALFVNKDGKIEQRTLQISQSIGHSWLVESGVADGDRILVEGAQQVRVGQDVATVEAVIDDNTGEIVSRGARR
ncbi:efflux transporter periplasmic adaptor subunit [Rhodoblastus sphagnicola]|uniref:Efflux transporter periplasmic adaptor subunit n=2 Tax=Rhodoblastus sphagnicola TaxID=333368 RepID=A0A2S6MUA2_9HYPH|nr:efflux RND transporter periplasmic adaptor subunit [Rhodoblastus sphagnicola]PPQ25943.1 efflux transporter periplasmic adaptor subunit [Rhodoblastus sphagnicola]